ncbi:MAG: hypothetical protein ISR60_01180 [Anaerolineales bacterium]|nr:hypothetical protein [Anaerolineales bacterium]
MLFTPALTACSGIDYIEPPAMPRTLSVSYTPALGWIAEDLNRCALDTLEIALTVTEAPASGLDFGAAEAYLRLGATPEATPHTATLLGYESIVVIAHPDVSPSHLEVIDVNIHYTHLNAEYQTWTYPPGDELRVTFDAVVLKGAQPSPHTRIAPHPTAMLEALAANPGSVGYISEHWLPADVQSADPGLEYAQALRQPILAITATEPQGSTRQFLACLQNALP